MAQQILLKRSAVQGKIPTTTDLDLGEIGLNTYDGKMFIKKNDGTEGIIEVTGGVLNIQETQFTATAGQTAFVLTAKVVSSNQLEVYTNRLIDYKSEYSVSDDGTDTTITFTNGKSANDIVRIATYA